MENTKNFELLKLDWKSVFSHLWGWVSSQTDFKLLFIHLKIRAGSRWQLLSKMVESGVQQMDKKSSKETTKHIVQSFIWHKAFTQ